MSYLTRPTPGLHHALIKPGPLVSDMSGSIGGSTFARNRGGLYVRSRVSPLNPNSPAQVAARARLGSLSNAWATVLTEAQRDAWDLYADNVPLTNALGESRNVSGINMYARANSVILAAGGTRLDDAPTEFTQGPTITPTITLDSGNDQLTVSDLGDYDLADGAVWGIVQQGRPQNPGVNFYASPFTQVGEFEAVESTGEPPFGPFDLEHPIGAGQVVFVRTAFATADGRLGGPVIQRFPVT